ncbi:phosphonate ABC transporter substrate-binding protein [[Phormidium ambiguum] IAM M-71]|uniref:Phosphonate ABC transporter substrate-binding protein n=1 Tax=[Phormidium ambiguum] IAM M-71 TaxID=454136 RepID=A0A1U7IBJ3_9CYAN|nr:PhnD/SsuA/transferrin family substrate-binding protein [Phormidium ambiguum]OKH33932.1 phosphonate ABC transporter substrate-binding protein [Phormidium ambiguum IAM M-71]
MKRRDFLGFSLLFLASCAEATTNRNNTKITSEKLRFTVTETQSIEELQRDYGALKTVLEEIWETKIEFVPIGSYTAAAAALQLDQVDLVLTGPSEYVVMRARTNAVPVIALTRPNYHTVISVTVNSGIKSVAQLKGKKVAMWEIGSTSGHLGPTKMLMDAGLNPQSDVKIFMLKGDGLPALRKGKVDAWAGSAVKYEKFLQDEALLEKNLPLIAKGPLLPNDLFVANSKFDANFIKDISAKMLDNQDKLLSSLLSVEEGKYKGSQLISTSDANYDMIRQVYEAIGQGSFVK